jgi:hypothetical protein
VAGPSGCGKSVFIAKLLSNVEVMITPVPENIMYCYTEYQPMFDEFPHVNFVEGIPDIGQFTGEHRTLLILDDLMNTNSDSISELFTRVSHHRNVSVFYLTQNIFHKSKHSRTISLNAHYIIFFKNPRDAQQISILSRQMYPTQGKFLVEAFRDATEYPFGYLLIDLKADTQEKFRIRTNIFPDEQQYAYVPI